MPLPDENLILSPEVMQDMVSHSEPVGREIEDFILRLSDNPFSPKLLEESVDNGDDSFYHCLPSGCYVSWEIEVDVQHPRFGALEGVTVRVTAAKFAPKP
jgi:hypothetical protein